MGTENLFRIVLLFLTLAVYLTRIWHAWKQPKSHAIKIAPMRLSTVVMAFWFASLLAYAYGFARLDYHLPFSNGLRWFGMTCMLVALPLSIWGWVYGSVGEYITSRVSAAEVFEDFGPHQLALNPTYVTFFICDAGAIILSANLAVLVTGVAALIAMGVRVKRIYAQPA